MLCFEFCSTSHTTRSNGVGDKSSSYVVFNLKLDWIVLSMQWEHFLLIIPFIVFECLVLLNSLCLKQLQTLS